jgi:outer membrane protein assembly factor BamB
LFKISLESGKILNSVDVRGSVLGTGADAITENGESRIPFDPAQHLQRPGLLLHKGFVHLAFASHGDQGTFHGWIFSYRADDLTGGPSFITTPHGMSEMVGSGIWQSGMGLTVDELGFVYLSTGNGDFAPEQEDWGNSLLKLDFSPETGVFHRVDSFTPFNQSELNALDLDVGSAGVLFVPPRYLIGAGKSGKFYVLNRDHLGGYTPEKNGDVGAIQVMQVTEPAVDKIINGEFMWNIHGAPVFWNDTVYVMGESDPVKAFHIDLASGRLDPSPVSRSNFVGPIGMPGGFITLSMNSLRTDQTAIVWVVHHLDGSAVYEDRPGRLYAFDAHDLTHVLWSSDNKKSDQLGLFAKFVPPTVADGKVFQATFSNKVVVYGLKVPGTFSGSRSVK